jgi:serine/threonine protein kinase
MTKKVHIPGAGQVSLSQKHFVASGGEGEIYGLGDTIYKIYHDPKKMIPQGKFDDLSILDERHIVNPQKIILNGKGAPIGFTMEWFKQNHPICKVFSTGFRKKSGFSPEDAAKLVENMQKLIDFVHSKECLIVDFNDINFLIDENKLTQPIFIDVDSYKTKNYPPTAITPYAQDHSTKEFSRLSDWYSFGIIAFQVFIGMHPFKGNCDGFAKGEVIERMKSNKSVLNKKAKVPPSARDFSHIPSDMRPWFEDIFEHGKRKEPPLISGRIEVAKPVYTHVKGSNSFDIDLVKSYDKQIKYHFAFMNENIVRSGNELHVGARRYSMSHPDSEVVISPDTMVPIEITKSNFRPLDSKDEISHQFKVEQLSVSKNVPIIKSGDSVYTSPIKKFADYMMAVDKTWPVMPLSTRLFSGMAYQNVLGVPYIWIPTLSKDRISGEFIKVPELNGHSIISAKCIQNVAVVIGYKGQEYSRFVIRTDQSKYDIKVIENLDTQSDINFTVLDKGVVVLMNENSEIELFSSKLGEKAVKVIEDKQVDNSCNLSSNGSQVLFYKGKDLYKLRMKK